MDTLLKTYVCAIAIYVLSCSLMFGQGGSWTFQEGNGEAKGRRDSLTIFDNLGNLVRQLETGASGSDLELMFLLMRKSLDRTPRNASDSTVASQSTPEAVSPVRIPENRQTEVGVQDSLTPQIESHDSLIFQNQILDSLMSRNEPSPCRQPLLAIKSNLLFDFAYMPKYGFCPLPNAALEYYPRKGYWTLGASLDSPWWNKKGTHKFFQARNWQAEVRRYMRCRNASFEHLFIQAYAHVATYSVSLNGKSGWRGEGCGAGLGLGYVYSLSERWRIEAGVQFGGFFTQYDPYVFGDPIDRIDNGYFYYDWEGRTEDFQLRQYRYTWVGPTRVGLTISYNLLLRHRQKGDGP